MYENLEKYFIQTKTKQDYICMNLKIFKV